MNEADFQGADGRFIKFLTSSVFWEMSVCVLLVVAVLKDVVLIPVRAAPRDAEKELDELYEVAQAVRDKWKTDVSYPRPPAAA